MRRNWTREELILAFNLYCKIPFGKCNKRTKEVIHLANLIERTPSAVAFKLVNFASFDPYHQKRGVSGMKNAGKLDKEIYEEFSNNWDELIYESEILLNKKEGNAPIEQQIIREIKSYKEGEDITRVVKTRVNQSFFRTVVLNIYAQKCAVSNIDLPELLIASHIVPWSANKKERLNPSNGICLSALYDKLFDKGFMTISNNLEITFSSKLERLSDKDAFENFIKRFEGKSINMPEKFYPKDEFLDFHRNEIFIK